MASRIDVFSSSVGTKLLVGITGVLLVLYLIIHVGGNLMVFGGPAAFNKYAYTLEGNPLLPIVEILLALVFVIHIYKTIRMFVANQDARPVRYAMKTRAGRPSRKTLASSTMIFLSGWPRLKVSPTLEPLAASMTLIGETLPPLFTGT